jgi:hypothetical protein
MAAKNNKGVWVSPNTSKGRLDWAVKQAGAQHATATYHNKADAFQRSRQIAKNNKSELFIQTKNGQIQNRNSYGHDPIRRKG